MGIDDGLMQLPDDRDRVVAQLLSRSWGELEALEHSGYILFPDQLYRRCKNGTFEGVPIAIRAPREHERREARVMARSRAQKEGLDPDRDADLIGELETVEILWRAIRSPSPPHEPLTVDAAELERSYDRPALMQAYAKLDAVYRIIDPAPQSLTDNEMLALVAALAKERNLLPLAVCAPGARDSFTLTMAVRLQSLLASRSSSAPSERSTPG